jgi:hypothetical protein
MQGWANRPSVARPIWALCILIDERRAARIAQTVAQSLPAVWSEMLRVFRDAGERGRKP